MYSELHEIWKRELENAELEKLAPDFYPRTADYLRRLGEEGRMLDKRTAKARLLKVENHNAKRMLRELAQARYGKLTKKLASGEKIQSDFLTDEEARIFAPCSSLCETYQSFIGHLLRGKVSTIDVGTQRKTIVLRLLGDVPEIVGVDLKIYGPFKVEDVVSLPAGNAQVLIKQELAEKVEAN
jgi:DNA replication initiation complex subunit (GINS family)